MSEPQVAGIRIHNEGDRVVIEVTGERWEGNARDAERLLTRLHYVLGRARPGTTIASVFVNGTLWGGKTLENDVESALDDARQLLADLSAQIDRLVAKRDSESSDTE
jgi:hypothetical protein